MDKNQVVQHLERIASMKTLNGDNSFSVNAYRNAARKISTANIEITPDNLKKIYGINKIADTVIEFMKRGTSSRYEELAGQVPMGCLEMIDAVHGIGPVKAKKLLENGIHNLQELIVAAEGGKLDPNLAKSVLFARDVKSGRIPISQAYPVGKAVLDIISPLVLKVELCGSLRRQKETVKDLDVVACISDKKIFPETFDKIIKTLRKATILVDVINSGQVKCALRVFKYDVQINCDVWLVEPNYWGTALNYATGSKSHNARLRGVGVRQGLKINEYGIFNRKTGERLGGEDEHDLYRLLGIEYVEPKEREE